MRMLTLICLVLAQPVVGQASRNLRAVEEADQMIQMPDPVFESMPQSSLDSATLADMGFEQPYACDTVRFEARDGKSLFARRFQGHVEKAIVLIHGVLSSNFMMNKTAGLLSETTGYTVITLDLRGHGNSAGRPGDVDYIGQYTDDLDDVVVRLRDDFGYTKILLAGHSMGGGIVLRYAMQKHAPEVNGYILMAPLLGHDAPTLPKAGKDSGEEPFMKIHLARIIGLSILNSMGIHAKDSLPVLFFNQPQWMPIHHYTYRSNISMAPLQYKEGLKAIKKPLLLLVGTRDEAFVVDEFEPAVRRYCKGEVVVVDGATHNGIRHHSESMKAVRQWIQTVN